MDYQHDYETRRNDVIFQSYHSSLIFLVSGQAQHGFNFFSGSLELSVGFGVDSDDPIAENEQNIMKLETNVRPSKVKPEEIAMLLFRVN